MKARVFVTLKNGVLDPQGKAIGHALNNLGFASVGGVRQGKLIEIELAESEASCELYGILKRPDEKYVTERAYDNPKFVEDMVRNVALRLNEEARPP